MKRYIIKVNEFEGIEIQRFDGFFRYPFVIRERYTEDEDGWTITSRTSCRIRNLLRRMEQNGQAVLVETSKDLFHKTWVIDVREGAAVGMRLPYGDRAPVVLLPTMDMIRELDLGDGPEDLECSDVMMDTGFDLEM